MVVEEASEPATGVGSAALVEGADRRHRAVKVEPIEQRVQVAEVEAVRTKVERVVVQGRRSPPDEEPVQMAVNLGADGTRRVFGLAGDGLCRHDHVRLHLHDAPTGLCGEPLSPRPLVAQIAAVADDQGGVPAQGQGNLRRRSPAYDQFYAPPLQGCLRVL